MKSCKRLNASDDMGNSAQESRKNPSELVFHNLGFSSNAEQTRTGGKIE